MKGLTSDDIRHAFEALARELPPADSPCELVVVGGAALVLLFEARSSTKDVDVAIADRVILDAARRVANQLSLPPDWLNDAAKGYMNGVAPGSVLLATGNLVVRTLAVQQRLAMKLSAWRDDVDIDDAQLLLGKLLGTKEEVWRLVEPFLVPGRELKATYAFEDLWEAKNEPE